MRRRSVAAVRRSGLDTGHVGRPRCATLATALRGTLHRAARDMSEYAHNDLNSIHEPYQGGVLSLTGELQAHLGEVDRVLFAHQHDPSVTTECHFAHDLAARTVKHDATISPTPPATNRCHQATLLRDFSVAMASGVQAREAARLSCRQESRANMRYECLATRSNTTTRHSMAAARLYRVLRVYHEPSRTSRAPNNMAEIPCLLTHVISCSAIPHWHSSDGLRGIDSLAFLHSPRCPLSHAQAAAIAPSHRRCHAHLPSTWPSVASAARVRPTLNSPQASSH